jgi:hypothetical protein
MTKTNSKKFRFHEGSFKIKFGDKELRLPAIKTIILILFAGALILLAYSDWNCGPIKHDADDMPKIKQKK